MKEIYKQTKFSNYEVSNLGSVRNSHSKRIRKPSISFGYNRICISVKGVTSMYFVHRLVAETFTEKTGSIVNHKDGNKLNNNISNLEWCNHQYNTIHMYRNIFTKKINKDNAEEIRGLCKKGVKQLEIAKMFGISDGMVSAIKHNYYWN